MVGKLISCLVENGHLYFYTQQIDLRAKWMVTRLTSKVPNVKCFKFVFSNLEKIQKNFY